MPKRPLRYSINITLDGCFDHRAILPDEELQRRAVENLDQADALFFGQVTARGGGVKLPLALAELGLIDDYEFVVRPSL